MMIVVKSVLYVMILVITQYISLEVYWVLPNRFLSLSFSLLVYLQLEQVLGVVRVVLKMLEVEVEVLDEVVTGLLSPREDMVSIILYLID